MERSFSILAVDDDAKLLRSLRLILTPEPYTVFTTTDPENVLGLLEEKDINLVLLDLKMPGRDGLSVLHDIVRLFPDITVIMLTGHGGVREVVRAIKIGAADFLEKPCPPDLLCQRLATYHAIWLQQQQKGGDTPAFHFPKLIGECPLMQQLKAMIIKVAASEATILIQGESGTGKELVARAVHQHSVRHAGPFIPVDCAAISENVLESELFGHEKGAFTGADSSTKGLIRSAEGGTLFLDEIGELPLNMQAKLLRTLQEHEVRPVGSPKAYSVDIRVLAATNRNLEQETAQGRFRNDLFYRLSAISLDLPPLRKRGDDIELLALHFANRFNEGTPVPISSEALQLLLNYHWPGNIRELENVTRRAVALSENALIDTDDLPATIAISSDDGLPTGPDKDSLVSYEKMALQNALKKTGYNKRKAAALLGIGEATLYRKLKQYSLSK